MSENIARVPRDPTASVRTREALDMLAIILNSLINSGTILQTGQGTFGVTDLAIYGSGPPAASLGTAPCVYFDIGDPSNIKFWYKT